VLVLSAPIYYALELTPVCNNCCPGCGNVFAHNRAPLSASCWQHILERIAPHVQVLKLTGGEPTLHPQFESIIHTVAELDLPFTLFTNARWTDPEKFIGLLTSALQCVGLLVSLHGADETDHEAFTGHPGSFEETTTNISRAVQAGLRVHVSTVITRWNWNRVREIAQLGQGLGARHMVFNRYIGPKNSQLEPDDDQLLAAIASIGSLQRKGLPVKFGNCIPQCFVDNSSRGCWAGRAYCTIDPWGNMRPCSHSPLVVGNVLERPIEELWHSEKMNHWRALLPVECKQCSEFFSCQGGCRAMIEIRQSARDPLATQPLQDYNRAPREMVLFRGAHPTLSCTIKSDHFGYALIRGESLYPVPNSAKLLLEALDGQNTLEEILDRFGQEALNLTGVLYEQGLIELLQ